MSEPIIPNPNPTTIPEKVYDKQYIPTTTISAEPNQPWNCSFIAVSFDGNEAVLNDQFIVTLKDVKGLAAVDADIATAMGAMLAVLGKYAVLCKVANVSEVTLENIVATLAAVQGGE